MNYIVLDLEATCWKEKDVSQRNEIIEIGALKINPWGQVEDEFSEFVKPVLYPELSDFCRKLTTIDKSDIDVADSFDMVIERFRTWINMQEPYVLCSWGFYDKKQLTKDCMLHGLDTKWLNRHISLKHQYAMLHDLPKPMTMEEALHREGIKLEGQHHRGIDDARNIAKIFMPYRKEWKINSKN